MHEIKANTRLKDKIIIEEANKLAKRNADAKILAALLASIHKVEPAVIPSAVGALMEAAEEYLKSKIIIDKDNRRSNPRLAEARASINDLHKNLTNVIDLIQNLPFDAKKSIGQLTSAPVGKMSNEIKEIIHKVNDVKIFLDSQPNKKNDGARVILGYKVAIVFQDILGIKPTTISDKHSLLKTPKSNAAKIKIAAYAQVLRQTLIIAGVCNFDMTNLIIQAFALLKEKSFLPNNDKPDMLSRAVIALSIGNLSECRKCPRVKRLNSALVVKKTVIRNGNPYPQLRKRIPSFKGKVRILRPNYNLASSTTPPTLFRKNF